MTSASRPILVLAIWVLCGLGLAGTGQAFTLDEAEQAINRDAPAQAIPGLEGYAPRSQTETLRRLWLLGVANNRAGRPEAAVKPLARLVAEVPANPVFRLELARALIGAGQSERARYHLEQVRGTGLPPRAQVWVDAQIERLEKPKTWQGYMRFAIVPESNPAQRTRARNVNLGRLNFALAPGARERAATGVELGFGLAAVPMISDTTRIRFGGDVQAQLFGGHAPDDIMMRANVALLNFGASGRLLTTELFATQRWIDGDLYTRSQGIGLGYSRALGTRTRVRFASQLERIDYVRGSYDVDRTTASVNLVHAATGQLMLRAGVQLENRSSSYTPAGGFAAGVSAGGDYSFAGGLRLGLDLSYERNVYDGRQPLFGVERVDEKTAATIRLAHQSWTYRGFAPVLSLGVERQQSSIVLYSYRNLTARIGFTRSF